MDTPGWASRLARGEFPRSNRYPAEWILHNHMGPHPLWLMETLCQRRAATPGSVVLDLGCGTALTSVFLAREYDLQVVAADWWVPAEENRQRLVAAGVADQVTAVQAEAHRLPFPEGQFDAIVSVDAYHYFGTADLYLAEMTRLLRPGGWLGIVVPGLRHEPLVLPPPGLAPNWEWDFCSFHGPEWWSQHWAKTGLVTVEGAWWMQDGHHLWLEWAHIADDYAASQGRRPYEKEVALLEADHDQLLGFTIAVAINQGTPPRASVPASTR